VENTTEESQAGQEKPPATGFTKTYLTVLVIEVSLMSSLATVMAYDRFMAQKVVAVNVNEFLQEQKDLVLANKITVDDFKANLERYMAAMKNQPKNRVLILEDVIASKNLEKLSYK
jgi:hypothetical protein